MKVSINTPCRDLWPFPIWLGIEVKPVGLLLVIVMTVCRNIMDQTLHSNTKECSVAELRYFTLMSVFSSWTRMLFLSSLYLNFKICGYIKKKRLLQKKEFCKIKGPYWLWQLHILEAGDARM